MCTSLGDKLDTLSVYVCESSLEVQCAWCPYVGVACAVSPYAVTA